MVSCLLASISIIFIFYCSISNIHASTREILYAEQFFANDSDRFRTSVNELQSLGNNLMHNLSDNKSGVIFSGVFTNNTVLQREPHLASLYGTSDTTNTSITLTILNTLNGDIQHHYTQSMHNGDWKIILPQTYPNGGNYTLSIHCNHSINSTLYNITFGDVYFCSGQSNMNLELHFTFNSNYTLNNITQLHKYSNIRFFTKRPYALTDDISPYVIPYQHIDKYQWYQSYNIARLKRFSAACWYTLQSLVDEYNMSNIHFGLILSAIDGSKIEQWILNDTISTQCASVTNICPSVECGTLYNGMILPFINMTIKSVLWYQGENNVFEEDDILNNTGYGCLQKLMIDQWRALWSVVDNTTSSLLPFGVVQLAPGTSEGHIRSMPYFRWSQSLNYGILPNEQLLNVFMAQTYDIGDPWRATKNANLYPAPYDYNSTKWFLGPIHPRSKLHVGKRLAMGIHTYVYNNNGISNGPLINGCVLDTQRNVIQIDFNQDMLYDEEVIIQPFDLWYNQSLTETVKYQSAVRILSGDQWIKMDGNILGVGDDGYSIVINVSTSVMNGMAIDGVSYAWSDSPCCGDLNLQINPCPLAMCPIVTSKSKLPAIPFQARIIDNKCQCFPPQQCDGMGYDGDTLYTTTSNTIRRLTTADTTDVEGNDIKILIQNGDLFDDNEHDKIKMTFIFILAEGVCLCFLSGYCVIIRHRRSRMDIETLNNLSSTDQDFLPRRQNPLLDVNEDLDD